MTAGALNPGHGVFDREGRAPLERDELPARGLKHVRGVSPDQRDHETPRLVGAQYGELVRLAAGEDPVAV